MRLWRRSGADYAERFDGGYGLDPRLFSFRGRLGCAALRAMSPRPHLTNTAGKNQGIEREYKRGKSHAVSAPQGRASREG